MASSQPRLGGTGRSSTTVMSAHGCGIQPQSAEEKKNRQQSIPAKCFLIPELSGCPRKGEDSVSVISIVLVTRSISASFQHVFFL